MPENGVQRREEPTVPQWVCEHCYVHLVNGDCTEPDTCTPGSGDEHDPLHLFGDMRVTPGMLSDQHSCGRQCMCTQDDECEEHPSADAFTGDSRESQHHDPADHVGPDECDCERQEFSRWQCDGCGSYLHGSREAVTGWVAS